MRVRVGCEFRHAANQPVHAIVQVEPRPDGAFEVLEQELELSPPAPSHTFIDGFGNLCRRVDIPAGQSTLRYDAVVELDREPDPADESAVEVPAAELPDDALVYTLPSRYCPSDVLAGRALELFGDVEPGWTRVQRVVDWVHGHVEFGYGSSTTATTAIEVHDSGKGVCRDFAHLSVTFCRALGIPTRYAFGYLPDIDVPVAPEPMDFCAWTEVYLGGRWWTFDPRNNQRRIGRVLIGRGRDALDVAMVTSFGALPLENMTVWADEVA